MPRIAVTPTTPQTVSATEYDQKVIVGQVGSVSYVNTDSSGVLTSGESVTVENNTTLTVSSGRGYVSVLDVHGFLDSVPLHQHSISHVTGLQTALDAKAASSHTHDDRYFTEAETTAAVAGATSWLISLSGLTTPATNTGFTAFAATPTRRSSTSQNDEIGWDLYVPAGTWEFWLIHYAGSTRGIYTVTLDGSALTSFGAGSSTVDGYNGSNATTESTIGGIVVATAGVKRLKLEMDTKNASSSGYVGSVQAVGLRRTA